MLDKNVAYPTEWGKIMERLTRDSSSKYIHINSSCSSITKNNPIKKWLEDSNGYFSKEAQKVHEKMLNIINY